jgi:hypothetical protein
MLLEAGNKLLISHRRLFQHDAPRFFIGEVQAWEEGIAKVSGYSFVRDIPTSRILKKADRRTKLVPVASQAYIVYQLPDDVDLETVSFDWSRDGLRMMSDQTVLMDLVEFPQKGKI